MQSKKPATSGSEDLTRNSLVSYQEHWNNTYQDKADQNLGWYESDPEPSLSLIQECVSNKDIRMLHVGAGTSTLIDKLLTLGYRNLLVNDISTEAVKKMKERLGNQSAKIKWIVDDLTLPDLLLKEDLVDLWHDRAVLHFFTTEDGRKSYFDLIKRIVRPGGYVIIAVFNLQGAIQCSGLPVYRYSAEMISAHLGTDFQLKRSIDHLYTTPSGHPRPYIYTLYQRI